MWRNRFGRDSNLSFDRLLLMMMMIYTVCNCGRGPPNKTWRAARWRPVI